MTAVGDLLDGLEAAASKATPGPWWVNWDGAQEEWGEVLCVGGSVASVWKPADAACIVAEHNAAPLLVAALRAVEAWAAMNDDMARQYDEAAASVKDSALIYGAQERAEDCRAIAEGVRNAIARALGAERAIAGIRALLDGGEGGR